MLAVGPCESVVASGVDMGRHVVLARGTFQDVLACVRRHKTVELGNVEQTGRHGRAFCWQQRFQAHTVVAHRGADRRGHGHHDGQAAAQAVAQRRDLLTAALRHEPLACRIEVTHRPVLIHALHQRDAALKLLRLAWLQVQASFLTCEQVGAQHLKALARPRLSGLLHSGVDAEDLLNQHQRQPRATGARHVKRGHLEAVVGLKGDEVHVVSFG
ncbi:hypothetical protein D9M72_444930 [compost metagenome]